MSDLATVESTARSPQPPPRAALAVRSLRIDRMPGVAVGGGFAIDNLAEGVTVVHGPNGAGKSTTARAIELLLWPAAAQTGRVRAGAPTERSADGRVHLAGEFSVDGAPWTVELDGRHVQWRRHGAVEPAPDAGPAELRHRYRLALTDLLAATDADDLFAAAVQKALSGGFDLEAARAELGAGQRPAGRRVEAAAARSALAALREAQRRAESLERERTQTLPELEAELAQARTEEARSEAVASALRRLAAEDARTLAEATLAALPADQLRRCRADDEAMLADLAEQAERSTRAVVAARRRLAECAARLQGRSIGAEHADEAEALEEMAAVLERSSVERASVERALAGQRAARDEALRPLTSARSARGESTIAPESVAAALAGLREDHDATRIAREGHRLRARREAIEAQRRVLGQRTDAERVAAEVERLRQTRRDLADWLAAAPAVGGNRPPWQTSAALAVAALLTFCLAVFHHLAWLVLLVLLAALSFLSTRLPWDAGRREREAMQERVQRSGVRQPRSWSIEDVAARLRELENEVADATLADRTLSVHAALDADTRTLSADEGRHRAALRTIEERFGTVIALPADEGWLPTLASALADWQRAHRETTRLAAELASLNARSRATIRDATARVAPLGLGEIPVLADDEAGSESLRAATAMRRVARALRELIQCAKDAAAATRDLHESLEPAERRARAARDRFFVDRGLGLDDVAGLRALLSKLPAFEAAQRALDRAKGALEQAPAPVDLPQSRPELEAMKRRCDDAAARIQSLSLRLGELRGALDRAAEGADVTDAASAFHEARTRLIALREEERRGAAADVVLRLLETRVRERSKPEVLARAESLLHRLTQGRFHLRHASSSEGPAFRVHDLVAGTEKSLEELSAGERVQLLCAVRLAFIEHEERRSVPLLVDEVLGTADDRRASALMGALVDAARRGRQVICFTAQLDEVARWRVRLAAEPDVPHAIIDLGAIRTREAARSAPLPAIAPRPTVPAPQGLDHAAYGALLRVPALAPFGEPGQVHLWHAIDDPARLHALLDAGFTTIGQVRGYRASTGQPPPGADEATCAAVAAAERGVQHLFECWRRGRCRPIDFGELMATGAVSSTFEERMRSLLEEVHGDPAALLAALEAGKLAKWQRRSTEALRDALMERGLLPSGASMTDEELVLEVRARLHDDLRAGVLDTDWPRRVVARIACPRRADA